MINFSQIVNAIRRKSEHFQKFLLKELAASGQIEGDRLILNIKVPRTKLDQKIEQYVKEFVLCKECRKPDTKLSKETNVYIMKCLVCGAKHSIYMKL